ncbi:ABC transporter substrate-binding protein [Actinomadura meyerae]|uniref:ABC transporter substrate-binding protein n=1 Tax=Actinomadura meyerae TaxID=240840 RepID=UPI0015C659CB|nr:ABC transporter substrate-binding protein [Actinomadura meyerae]
MAPDGVPADFYLGTAYPLGIFSMYQMAWPLFLPGEDDFSIANGLASSYRASSDGLVHTIGVKKGFTFHDGSPIDAAAVTKVLHSYFFEDDSLRDDGPYGAVSAAFGSPTIVREVTAVDAGTVKVVLSQARLDIRDPLFQMPILNPKVLAKPGYGKSVADLRDAGSGPFRVTGFSPGEFVEFERYRAFPEKVSLDRLRLQQVPDPGARALAMQGKNADVVLDLAPEDHERLAGMDGNKQFAATPSSNVFFRFFTPKHPELEDPRVRRAIWLALDRDAYRTAFFNPTSSHKVDQPVVVKGVQGYSDGLDDLNHDLAQAKVLMRQAGVQRLTLRAITMESSGPILSLRRLHEAIAADLKKIGIEVKIDVVDPATYLSDRYNYDYEVLWYGNSFNPDFIFRLFYLGYPKPWAAPSPLADRRVADLVKNASSEVDHAKQVAAWQRLQRLNGEELFMGVPIASVGTSAVADGRVRGFDLGWHNRGALVWLFKNVAVG